jgi:hypothetical protein
MENGKKMKILEKEGRTKKRGKKMPFKSRRKNRRGR